jgi:hypothetical protein
MRLTAVLVPAGAIALAVAVAVALAASTMSMTAPATAPKGEIFDVQVSGSTDEFGLRWKAFVQTAGCQPTVVAAEAQPGAIGQNDHTVQGGGVTGPYSFTSLMSTTPGGQQLSGTVNVCAYLFRDKVGDRSTLATSVRSVRLTTSGPPPPTTSISVPPVASMSRAGTIRIFATCPRSCLVTVTYKGLGPARTVSKHLGRSRAQVGVNLLLDRATQKFVKLARRKRKSIAVSVTATAKPPTGAARTVSRTVHVV